MSISPPSIYQFAGKIWRRIRARGAIAVGLLMFMPLANAANGAPKISFENAAADGSEIAVRNPVIIAGAASDRHGIRGVTAYIKRLDGAYVAPNGKLVRDPIDIPVSFEALKNTRWQSAAVQVPAGRYEFIVSATDRKGKSSNPYILPIRIGNVAVATQPASQPWVAIQVPHNGASINGVAAFQGAAKHQQGISAVIGTVQDQASGLFLGNDGKFHRRAQLKMRVAQGREIKWAAPRMKLPAGNYLLSVKSIGTDGSQSKWVKSNFSIAGAATQQTIDATQPSSKPQNTPQTTGSVKLAANGMPYCSASNDPDGDGFGWHNNASCVVAGSRADSHPNCASAGSDPDGDGYGWENERSCIVITHCTSAASDPDGDGFGWENNRSCVVLNTAHQSRFPRCASNTSDPDGDGYGWENNKTCTVAK